MGVRVPFRGRVVALHRLLVRLRRPCACTRPPPCVPWSPRRRPPCSCPRGVRWPTRRAVGLVGRARFGGAIRFGHHRSLAHENPGRHPWATPQSHATPGKAGFTDVVPCGPPHGVQRERQAVAARAAYCRRIASRVSTGSGSAAATGHDGLAPVSAHAACLAAPSATYSPGSGTVTALEDLRRHRLHRGILRGTADEQEPLRDHALRAHRVEAVGEPAEHALDRRPRRCRRGPATCPPPRGGARDIRARTFGRAGSGHARARGHETVSHEPGSPASSGRPTSACACSSARRSRSWRRNGGRRGRRSSGSRSRR